jgi:hypothetical protein
MSIATHQKSDSHMVANKANIKPGSFPEGLKWSGGEAVASLESLYQFVNGECSRAADWYFSKKKTMKFLGYVSRVGSILAIAIAGIIPILGEIYEKADVPGLSPAWSTFALAIAGIFLSLDRFGGYTSSWIRFIRAAQTLGRLQSDFRIEWQRQRLILQGRAAEPETVADSIKLCRDFLARANQLIETETDEWAKEFQKVLAELENKKNVNDDNSI